MSGLATLVGAIRQRLGPSRLPLAAVEPQSIATNQPDPGAAVRWLDPITIGGVARPALLCHPDSSIAFRLDAPAGAELVAWCGLQPESWSSNRGGVRFTLSVACGGAARRDSVVVDPRRRSGDRRWRRLRVPLPDGGRSEAVVTLATSLPPDASPASAWAVWGDPHLRWSRPLEAQVASAIGAVRLLGVRGAVRRLVQLASAPAPASSYREWVAAHTPDEAALERLAREVSGLAAQPRVSVIVPVFNTPPVWLTRAVESVRRQVYPHWQLSLCDDGSTDEGTRAILARLSGDDRITLHRLPGNQGISAASNAALANASGDWIALLDHDDELAPHALAELVKVINRRPGADVVYSDEDKIDPSGERSDPFFKPDWAPEHLLSCMYTCHLFAARRALVEAAGGFRLGYEGSQDYDLMLRLSDRTSRIEHIPEVLYHWRKSPDSAAGSGLAKPWAIDAGHRALADYASRNGLDAEVLAGPSPGRYRVRRRVPANQSVSVLVGAFDPLASARDAAALVSRLRSDGGNRVVGVDMMLTGDPRDSDEARVESGARLVRVAAGASRLAVVNRILGDARGEHLLFIAPGLLPSGPGWLEALIEYSMDEGVGAVGARLLDAEGRIRHIGLVMGLKGIASSPFAGYPGATHGYVSSAVGTRNYSAVSGACLMTRRVVFDALEGLDERAGDTYAAVDYCLRARQAGHRVVYTPYACLQETHANSSVEDAMAAEFMRARWADVIADDPFYNSNLSRDFLDCRPRT